MCSVDIPEPEVITPAINLDPTAGDRTKVKTGDKVNKKKKKTGLGELTSAGGAATISDLLGGLTIGQAGLAAAPTAPLGPKPI